MGEILSSGSAKIKNSGLGLLQTRIQTN